MVKKKKQIIIHPDKKMFEYEGNFFREKTVKLKKIDGVCHADKVIFEEINIKEEEEKLKFIKEKLKKQITTDRVIEELLKTLPTKDINKIHKLLQNKKTKIKKQDGCLGLKIDGGKHNNIFLNIFD